MEKIEKFSLYDEDIHTVASDNSYGNELRSTLLVNALRGLTQEQQAGLCIDLFERNDNKEMILDRINNKSEEKIIQTCKECGIFVFTPDGKMCMNGHLI